MEVNRCVFVAGKRRNLLAVEIKNNNGEIANLSYKSYFLDFLGSENNNFSPTSPYNGFSEIDVFSKQVCKKQENLLINGNKLIIDLPTFQYYSIEAALDYIGLFVFSENYEKMWNYAYYANQIIFIHKLPHISGMSDNREFNMRCTVYQEEKDTYNLY